VVGLLQPGEGLAEFHSAVPLAEARAHAVCTPMCGAVPSNWSGYTERAPVTFTKCHGMVCMQKIGWQVDMPLVDRPSIHTFWIEWQPFNRSLSSTWPLTLDAVQDLQRAP
jgi:hypothetical protein